MSATRSSARLAAICASLAASLALSTTPAHAGTYPVYACNDAPGGATRTWAQAATAPASQFDFVAACPTEAPDPYGRLVNGIGVADRVNAWDEGEPDGTYAEWRFDAAHGTAIVAAAVTRDIGNRDEWTPYGRIDGVDQPGESCVRGMNQSFCRIHGTRTFTGLNARSIAYGVRCVTAPYCAHLWDLRAVWVLVLGATVTLDDREAPSVSVVEGSGVADGRWWNGAGVVVFSGQDNTGIRRRRVVVDGVSRVVVDAPGAAAGGCGEVGEGVAYTYSRPCADGRGLNGLRSLAVDPCRWGDGVHSVRGGVTDTGGLEAVSSAAVVARVDCSAPQVDLDVAGPEVVEGDSVAPVVVASDSTSGLRETLVQVSVDDGAWVSLGSGVVAEAGRSYRFRARAVDVARNSSGWLGSGTVVGVAPPRVEPPAGGGEAQPALPVLVPPPAPAPRVPVLEETVPADEPVLPAEVAADAEGPAQEARPTILMPPPADPGLRIIRVLRSRRTLLVSGTAAPGLITRATVRATLQRRAWTGRAVVREGRWRARFVLDRKARGRIRNVRATTPAAPGFAPGSATWQRKPLHPLR